MIAEYAERLRADVLAVVAEAYLLEPDEVMRSRTRTATEARHVAFYLATRALPVRFIAADVCEIFYGHRNANTIHKALRRLAEQLQSEPPLREVVDDLAGRLRERRSA